jgi:adenine-specific DNA-methyltransferase
LPKSLLEQLPEIVKEGRRQAERILESLEGRHRVRLQTREWVLPSKDVAEADWIAQAQRRERLAGEGDADWTNRLIYGDNLLAMAALLAGDEHTPSLRGKVDLIYIEAVPAPPPPSPKNSAGAGSPPTSASPPA